MDITALPSLLTALDVIAVALLLAAWVGMTALIERTGTRRPSVSVLMAGYRREWMRHTISRQPRVYDAMIVTSLRQGTAFFASTSMIALGGGLALIANVEQLSDVASELTLDQTPQVVWEVKLILVLFLVANAFLKFVWSHRVFGYCSVVMASVPNDEDDPIALHRVEQAADLNITAARAFNRGLRSVYFALGALAWLLGAVPLLAATAITVAVLWRREFASATRATLMKSHP
ncbi:DUF599 domain-containing protein [Meridianimarinicoccus roseus]|jgi:uncharacterized membrane protein|uniref:DUF599 domain-containing protein n=1 Tax=Meridianimarinicoccus roseus TaxID=2072018 RepID=A0A2V2LFV6_9RHOB|nr:DUF599 domain-containing protein [Meridianimarinicoccus roseus]PWR03872.1 DUF599 domain-containing protein [Meridianimarinicoccus roseus]